MCPSRQRQQQWWRSEVVAVAVDVLIDNCGVSKPAREQIPCCMAKAAGSLHMLVVAGCEFFCRIRGVWFVVAIPIMHTFKAKQTYRGPPYPIPRIHRLWLAVPGEKSSCCRSSLRQLLQVRQQ